MRILRFGILLAILVVVAPAADAHGRSRSSSRWSVEGSRVRMTFTVDAREATRLARLGLRGEPALAGYLGETVVPLVSGSPCEAVTPVRAVPSRPGHLRFEGTWNCPSDGELELQVDAWFDVAPSHIHIALLEADPPCELVFTTGWRRRSLGKGTGRLGWLSWIGLGTEHILGGYDHLAFLLGLLLLAGSGRGVLLLATGFTAGHSLTLSMAALDLVVVRAPGVEAFIGFTIALVAIENLVVGTRIRGWAAIGVLLGSLCLIPLRNRAALSPASLVGLGLLGACLLALARDRGEVGRVRPVLTVLFGLVHGFGFATALSDVGLPRGHALGALLGFNVGVELGQVLVVLPLVGLGMLTRLRRTPWVTGCGSAALCSLGLYWFLTRSVVL